MIDRRAFGLAALGLALTLGACSSDEVCDTCKPRLSGPLELTGTISYPMLPELPPDAQISVELVRTQGAGRTNSVVTSTTMPAAGARQPVPFTLNYSGGSIEPNTLYYVVGRIRSGNQLLMINDRGYQLPENGTGPMDIMLVVVPKQLGNRTGN